MYKQKLQASLFHFSLSLILVIIVIGSMLFFFFPSLYLGVTDFKELSYIILSVDLILGPLLTFIVFSPKKRKSALYIDFSVIGVIQLTALIYGAYTLYQVHPVYITFNIDRFTVISAKDAQPYKAKYDEYKVPKLIAGKLAFAKMPDDKDTQEELLFSATSGGRDLDQSVEYYEPYEQNVKNIINKGLDPKLITENAKLDKKIESFMDRHQRNIDNFVFLPINSAKKDAIIVLDKASAQPIATINTDPWLFSKK